MKKFSIEIKENKIAAIYDKRYPYPFDITDGKGNFANLVFTEKDEDITKQTTDEYIPYNEQYCGYTEYADNTFKNDKNDLSLIISETEFGLLLHQRCDITALSSSGIFLPLNFMPCKNGVWQEQFLISSPYHTADKKHWLYYFTKPDGKNLAVITEGDIAAYKFNYSTFSCGHFIQGFSFLANFDTAYNEPRNSVHNLKIHLVPVENYLEALEVASKIWDIPVLTYERSSVKIGTEFDFELIGKADKFAVAAPDGSITEINSLKYTPTQYGIYTVTPYKNGVAGADCSFFAYDGIGDIFTRACNYLKDDEDVILGETADGVKVWRPAHLAYRGYHDLNLCENCMWVPAMLRNAILFGNNQKFDKALKNFLHIALPDGKSPTIDRCSLMKDEGYRTKGSTRIQEAYAGVSLLLDAYRLYGDKKYLEFAIDTLTARLKADLKDGKIIRDNNGHLEDYTTVTCMVIPVVDLALFLKARGDSRYEFFQNAAIQIADFVTKRGMNFPTEGEQPEDFNTEMEEGSMSCSALTVLLVANYIQNKPEYIKYAAEVLSVHDAYTVHTHHPVLFRSSLRWWETIWEGDHNGPAVCFGHAWSIWRAEAQFYFGLLAFDDKRLFDSYNGFMGNYAKTLKDGKTHAIYQYEPIASESGPFEDYQYRSVEGFPQTADSGLAYYVFVRDYNCWQKTAAIVKVNGKTHYLGCHLENGKIIFDGIRFEQLYIGDVTGTFALKTDKPIKIITNKNVTTTDNLIIEVK